MQRIGFPLFLKSILPIKSISWKMMHAFKQENIIEYEKYQ